VGARESDRYLWNHCWLSKVCHSISGFITIIKATWTYSGFTCCNLCGLLKPLMACLSLQVRWDQDWQLELPMNYYLRSWYYGNLVRTTMIQWKVTTHLAWVYMSAIITWYAPGCSVRIYLNVLTWPRYTSKYALAENSVACGWPVCHSWSVAYS